MDELGKKVREWQVKFDAGDKSFLCGQWWEDTWCRKNIKVRRRSKRARVRMRVRVRVRNG